MLLCAIAFFRRAGGESPVDVPQPGTFVPGSLIQEKDMLVSNIKGMSVVLLFVALALSAVAQPPAKEGKSPGADLRKLLGAPDSEVRLRAALTLAARQDEQAIGVLIDLLADLPAAQSRLAEQALQALAEEWSPTPALARDDEVSRRIRRDAWAAWWRNTDGPALLAAFRKRTLSPEQTEQAQSLIAQLGHKVFAKRQAATAALVALGPPVVPLLRQAMPGTDLEQRRRIESCLEQIARNADQTTLPLVAVRLLALRNQPGASEALLAYVPFTDAEGMRWEVVQGLTNLAVRSRTPDPALAKALSDKVPLRRSVAAQVLAIVGRAEDRPAIRKLLTDPDQAVRLRVAIALACAVDREAVPVLIDLLADLPRGEIWQVEEILYRLAGVTAPQMEPADDAAGRTKYRDTWKAWWKDNGGKTKLAAMPVPPPLLGYKVLVLVGDPERSIGRVVEMDRDGKVRWQIDGLSYPVDAHVLPGNRVLIAETGASRITERDFKGNILWQKSDLPSSPSHVQRLANGNTFVCTYAGLMEFDPAGKTVLDIKVEGIMSACKTADGQMIYLTGDGACVRLDAAGKEIKRFASGLDVSAGGWIDLTPRGRILVDHLRGIGVGEFDLEGKRLWQTSVAVGSTAVRNGHVMAGNWSANTVTEFDRAGKVVWQYQVPSGYKPWRARGR
jgi:HEAT repeat protein